MKRLRFVRACRVMLGTCAVLAFAPSTPLFAQAIAPADLIGSWARQGEKEARFTFRTDSTMTASATTNVGPGVGTGRWRLVGDTLVVNNYMIAVKDQKGPAKFDRRVLVLKDKLLTMSRVDHTETGPQARIYERVDSVKVDPPKP